MKNRVLVILALLFPVVLFACYVTYGYKMNSYCWEKISTEKENLYKLDRKPFGFSYIKDGDIYNSPIYIGYANFPFGPTIYVNKRGNVVSTEAGIWLEHEIDWADVKVE